MKKKYLTFNEAMNEYHKSNESIEIRKFEELYHLYRKTFKEYGWKSFQECIDWFS